MRNYFKFIYIILILIIVIHNKNTQKEPIRSLPDTFDPNNTNVNQA